MVLDTLFIILVFAATLGIVATVLDFFLLGLVVRGPGLGRILFGALVSLKLWVAFILADFYVALISPGFVESHRQAIRLLLALYLVVQSIGSLIAIERWKRQKE